MIEVYKHIGMLDVFRSFISRVVLSTQIDNNHPVVDKFHSTAPYVGIINMIKDNADTDRFDPKSHIGKKKTGVYHLPVDSKLMKHPEIWASK